MGAFGSFLPNILFIVAALTPAQLLVGATAAPLARPRLVNCSSGFRHALKESSQWLAIKPYAFLFQNSVLLVESKKIAREVRDVTRFLQILARASVEK